MHTLEPNPPCIRTLHDDELKRLLAHHPRLPMRPEDCPTCDGAGSFRWYAAGEVVDYTCNCIEQIDLHHWLLNAGIGANYQRLGWGDATGVDVEPMQQVADYAEKIKSYAKRGIGLVLLGEVGTGKSLLASLLLKRLIHDGHAGYFVTFQELLDLFTSTWRNDEEKRWFEQRITNAEILVIDDMSREYEGRLGVAGPLVDHVLRTRVSSQRPTIVTTNQELAALGKLYSINALSLLVGCCRVIQFAGTDFRTNHLLQRSLDEADLGLTRPVVLQ